MKLTPFRVLVCLTNVLLCSVALLTKHRLCLCSRWCFWWDRGTDNVPSDVRASKQRLMEAERLGSATVSGHGTDTSRDLRSSTSGKNIWRTVCVLNQDAALGYVPFTNDSWRQTLVLKRGEGASSERHHSRRQVDTRMRSGSLAGVYCSHSSQSVVRI